MPFHAEISGCALGLPSWSQILVVVIDERRIQPNDGRNRHPGKVIFRLSKGEERIKDDMLEVHVIRPLPMTLGHQVDGFLMLPVQHVRYAKLIVRDRIIGPSGDLSFTVLHKPEIVLFIVELCVTFPRLKVIVRLVTLVNVIVRLPCSAGRTSGT